MDNSTAVFVLQVDNSGFRTIFNRNPDRQQIRSEAEMIQRLLQSAILVMIFTGCTQHASPTVEKPLASSWAATPIVCEIEFDPDHRISPEDIRMLNDAIPDAFFLPVQWRFSAIEIRTGKNTLLKAYPAAGVFRAYPQNGSKDVIQVSSPGQMELILDNSHFPRLKTEGRNTKIIFLTKKEKLEKKK